MRSKRKQTFRESCAEYTKALKEIGGAPVIIVGWLIAVAIIVVTIAAILVGLGLLTLLAWNYGVVALVAATGGSVSKIGLGTAICVNLAAAVLRRWVQGVRPAVVA